MIHINESIVRELKGIMIEAKSILLGLLDDTIVSFKRIPRLVTRIDNILGKMNDQEAQEVKQREEDLNKEASSMARISDLLDKATELQKEEDNAKR